ncbi:MAG TPA: hypothetical protein DHV93_05965 [Holophagaceae bacterium]|nr:hypothetical protein [Holophagaceae bacterium]
MRTEHRPAAAFVLLEVPGLDPINVITQDLGPSEGRLIIECFGQTWSYYWGAMGGQRLAEFVATSDPSYLCSKLQGCARLKKREVEYLYRIIAAVQQAMREVAGA